MKSLNFTCFIFCILILHEGTPITTNGLTHFSENSSTKPQNTLKQALFSKLSHRKPLTMAVIGGSNTAGGGISNESLLYYNIVSHWWNSNIYPNKGSKLTNHKMAIGGTGSDFFSFCFQNYLPKNLPDIVLVELSVNDYGYKYGSAAKPMELLTRRLLSLQTKPLVIYVHLVARGLYQNKITNKDCNNMEDLGLDELAMHYGIPSVSIRDYACPLMSSGQRELIDYQKGMFSKDGSHVGYKAHAQVANDLIKHFQSIVDFGRMPAMGFKRTNTKRKSQVVDYLPQPKFATSISDETMASSMCASFLTPDWTKPLIHNLQFRITHSKDFLYTSPEKSKQKVEHSQSRSDAYGTWASKTIGSLLNVSFIIPHGPKRSVTLIFRSIDNAAFSKVWLNSSKNISLAVYSTICGHSKSQTRLQPIATDVSPGNHTLHVESNGHGYFEVSGVVVGYAGYNGYEGYRPFNVNANLWNEENYKKLKC